MNDHLVLIGGKSATGKSASLMHMPQPEGVWYANCENNKKLPFRSKFREFNITDPLQLYELFTEAENHEAVHTIVVDTATYLMNMYENNYVKTATNTQKAWGDYATFWQNLMAQYVAKSTKNVIFLAHTMDILNESEMVTETMVKVKGSLMNQGIESYFSTVIACKKMPLSKLGDYDNELLEVTPEEEVLGFKYVYQTKLTKETVNERIRAPLGMWDTKETYIDNDAGKVLRRLHDYYS